MKHKNNTTKTARATVRGACRIRLARQELKKMARMKPAALYEATSLGTVTMDGKLVWAPKNKKFAVARCVDEGYLYTDDNEYRDKLLSFEKQGESLARRAKWRKFDRMGIAFDTSRRIEESEKQLPADWMPTGRTTLAEAFASASKIRN